MLIYACVKGPWINCRQCMVRTGVGGEHVSFFDSIRSVFQTLVTHDWVSEGQWRADASVHLYWAWFWYFKEKKRKTLLLASLYVFITQCNKLYFQYSCHCYCQK